MRDLPLDHDDHDDDTNQPTTPPRPARPPGAYYYDDRTGYEPYDPTCDEDEEDEDENRDGGGDGDDKRRPSRSPRLT